MQKAQHLRRELKKVPMRGRTEMDFIRQQKRAGIATCPLESIICGYSDTLTTL